MKVLGINGSARKGWNTQTFVRKAHEGAASVMGQRLVAKVKELKNDSVIIIRLPNQYCRKPSNFFSNLFF